MQIANMCDTCRLLSLRYLSVILVLAGDVVVGGFFVAVTAAATTATAAARDHVRQFPQPQHPHEEGQGYAFRREYCLIVRIPLENVQKTGQLIQLRFQTETKGVA